MQIWSCGGDKPRRDTEEISIPSPREASEWLVGKIGSLAAGILQIAASIVIAGIATLYAKERLQAELCDSHPHQLHARGQHLTDVSIATIRSVTNGVLGVAVIQAVLAGIGL